MNKELVFESKLENISLIENLVDEISGELDLVADIYGNILIASIEAVSNAIVHGNKLDSSKNVRVFISNDNGILTVEITDQGEGFNYDNIPDPTKPDNVEKPDGRGVFLMRHLADEVSFENDGSTVLLKFNI